MTRRFIPAAEVLMKSWDDPEFRKAYQEAGDELAWQMALVDVRRGAGLTQAQLAEKMGTSQAAIARLENGGTRPSIRTLERYARATGNRLRFAFVPEEGPAEMSEAAE